MQFNRKWFYQGNRRTNLMSDDLFLFIKKCGFNYLDGEELNETRGFQSIGWRYDTLKYFYFTFSQNNNSNNYWVDSTLCDWGSEWELLRYHTYSTSHQGLFFIPLKNNGFLINAYKDGVFMSPTTPLYSPFTYPYNSDSSFWICSYIGFFNNINNVYTYIRSRRRGSYFEYAYDGDNYGYIDFPYQRGSARTYSLSTYGDITGNKTDVKQNICTMIKYPYENGFLSNLFIVTTAPIQGQLRQGTGSIPCDSTGLENKFFSFNGRNFYGIYANVAVELPAN